MKSKTTIELNGKRYDAVTGAMLGEATAVPAPRGKNIDGFFRSRTTASAGIGTTHAQGITVLAGPAPAPKPKQGGRSLNHAKAHAPEAAKTVSVRVTSGAQHSQHLTVRRTPASPNHVKAHAAQHSQTLKREAVKRPAPSLRKQLGTKGSLQHAVPSLIVPKKSVASLDDTRLARAQSTARSPLVAHHTSQVPQKVHPTLASLSVQPVPEPTAVPPTTTPAPEPPSNKPTDIFEHALANAGNFIDVKAHHVHFKKKTRQHVLSVAAGTLALVVIAGFAAYQNTPGLQFKMASVEAGVSTHMPNLQSAGFAYNGVKAGNKTLTVGLKSGGKNYQLTQTPTNLSSEDMIQTAGATDASGNPDYRTVQAGSTSVYRFDNTSATWVKDGKWYSVSGNGALSDGQVQAIVQGS